MVLETFDDERNPVTPEAIPDNVNVIITPETDNSDRDRVTPEPTTNVSVQEILPLPEEASNAKKRKLSQPAVILSSTPYKNELEALQEERQEKDQARNERRQQRALKAMRNLNNSSTSAVLTKNKPGRVKPTTSKSSGERMTNSMGVHSTSQAVEDVEIELNLDEWYCFTCEETLLESMVRCSKCSRWVHQRCSGMSARTKKFTCVDCK